MRALDLRRIVALGLVGLAGLGIAACQSIAGIEDRTLDPDAPNPTPGDTPATAQCQSYCDTVMAACVGENAVYATQAHCLAICAKLAPGDSNEPVGNTVACRLRQAKIAQNSEPEETCRLAGPGGGDECGSDCEAYCTLYPQVCPDLYLYGDTKTCLDACQGLTDQNSYNLSDDHGGDTIECRLVHTASATVDPVEHCKHGPIVLPAEWCVNDPEQPPTCQEYCQIELAACRGDVAQYESKQQCLDVCEALDPGVNSDVDGNTVGCRRYHSFNSTLGADNHCPHSGPTGDGHCGDASTLEQATGRTGNCESYCQLVEAACPAEFAAELTNADDCMQTCIGLDEADRDTRYTVASAKNSTGLKCRVLHAVRAFQDAEACGAAVGGDPCQ